MLSPRLEMILNHIKGNSAADIGTDHAYIPIELAKRGMQVIASDISQGPLNIAEENVKKSGYYIDLRLGSGLAPLQIGETENIIIAGMGGEMIINIISAEEEKARNSLLLLQPMNYPERLRRYLYENSFTIIEEDLAIEGDKLYNLLIVKDGLNSIPFSDIDFHLPPLLYSNSLFDKLILKKKREFNKKLSGLSTNLLKNQKQIDETKQLLIDIEQIERKLQK